MDPSENPSGGTDLWNGEHAGVQPFGISKNPKTHYLPVPAVSKAMPGEQPDPRFEHDPPASPV